MRHFNLYRTLDRFTDSITGKERDLVHPTILVPGPLGSDASNSSSDAFRIRIRRIFSTAGTFDCGGWLVTGDVGYRDRDIVAVRIGDAILPAIEPDDVIAVLDPGAYGFSMSSIYNGRVRYTEVRANCGRVYVVRRGGATRT